MEEAAAPNLSHTYDLIPIGTHYNPQMVTFYIYFHIPK